MEGTRGTVDAILETFRSDYEVRAPFRQDRAQGVELGIEAAPAVEALLFGLSASREQSLDAPEFREALALFSLLGRRAGSLSVTPSTALSVVPSIVRAFREHGRDVQGTTEDTLRAVFVEGYVAAREEELAARAARSAAESVPIVRFAPRCVAMLIAGDHEADELREIVERYGRALLRADARAGVVDIAGLKSPTPERASEVFSCDATARMLGAQCIFTSVGEPWLEAAREGRVSFDLVLREATFEAGVARAIEAAGLELRPPRWIEKSVRDLLGRLR